MAGAMQATKPLPKTNRRAVFFALPMFNCINAGNGRRKMMMSQVKSRTAWYIKIP